MSLKRIQARSAIHLTVTPPPFLAARRVSMPKPLLLKMAFDSGYEAGAEDAGSGELLVETLVCGTHCLTWTPKRRGRSRWTIW